MNRPEDHHQKDLVQMVERQLRARGITDQKLLAAFLKVPRHFFVPAEFQSQTYEDHPVWIGYNQTLSQPYIVAFMLDCLELSAHDKVLEIGTGSGYETALLAELVAEVDSVEVIPELYESARNQLNLLGYSNVNLRCGDGREGWAGKGPFDKIVVAAATEEIPEALVAQLKEGGLMVVPVGDSKEQFLILGHKIKGVLETERLVSVRFVPLIASNH